MWPPGARPQHSHSLEQCIASHLELLQYKVERTLESWLSSGRKLGYDMDCVCVREGERKIYWPIHFHSPSFIISKLQAIPRIYFFHICYLWKSLLSPPTHICSCTFIFFFETRRQNQTTNSLKKISCSSSVDGREDGKGALLELCPPVGELCQPEHHFNSGCTLNHLLQTCITHYGHTLCVSPAISGSPSQTGHPPPAVGGEQDTQEPSGLWR